MAESSVLVLRVSVDNVVTLALNAEVATSGCKLDVLASHLRDAQFLHVLRLHHLAVLRLLARALEQLQVKGLDLTLLAPHDLAVNITGQRGILAHLDDDGSFIETKCDIVGIRCRGYGPHALEPVLELGDLLVSVSVVDIDCVIFAT